MEISALSASRVTVALVIKPGAECTGDANSSRSIHAAGRISQNLSRLKITTRYPVFRAWPVLLDRGHAAVRINMTRTGAVLEFTHRIMGFRALVFLVWSGLVIAGVAAGAIVLKRRKLPGNGFCIGSVTLRASQVVAVIERFVKQCRVTELVR